MDNMQLLNAILADLEDRIDPETEEDYFAQWVDFWEGRNGGQHFTPCRKKLTKPGIALPKININDAIRDPVLMLVKELTNASYFLGNSALIPSIRMNYGTGILSGLFGAEIFVMPYKLDTLPTTRVLKPGQLEQILEKGAPSLDVGFGKNVWETAELYLETVQKYPKVIKYLDVYHPDLQGPLDLAELMVGSDLCYLMYDEPEKAHAFLKLITDTYIRFMEKWQSLFPPKGRYSTHWGSMVLKGQIMLRSDSAMNMSPQFYREFSLPYDIQLVTRFDGGAIHFCGRGDHYIDIASDIPGLCGVNLSQPECNDMEKIFANTVDKNIKILGYSKKMIEDGYRRESGEYHGCLHVI